MKRTLFVIFACLLVLSLPVAAEAKVVPMAGKPVPPTVLTFFGDVNGTSDYPPPTQYGLTLEAMGSLSPYCAFGDGDFLRYGGGWSQAYTDTCWDYVLAEESSHLSGVTVYRTGGDNDGLYDANPLAAYHALFDALQGTDLWYAKQVPKAWVIMLASSYSGHQGWVGYSDTQGTWLHNTLDSITAGGANTIIVVTHYPLLNGKYGEPYDNLSSPPGSQVADANSLIQLFTDHGVDLVVTGNTHVYRRTNARYVQILTASGTLRQFGVGTIPSYPQTGDESESYDNAYGFLEVQVSGSHYLTVNNWSVATGGTKTLRSSIGLADR